MLAADSDTPPANVDVAAESEVRGPAMIKVDEADNGPWTFRFEEKVEEAEMIIASVVVRGVR